MHRLWSAASHTLFVSHNPLRQARMYPYFPDGKTGRAVKELAKVPGGEELSQALYRCLSFPYVQWPLMTRRGLLCWELANQGRPPPFRAQLSAPSTRPWLGFVPPGLAKLEEPLPPARDLEWIIYGANTQSPERPGDFPPPLPPPP